MAYNQNKFGRAWAVKNVNVLCTGRAADGNTVLFWVRNDTTWYFKLCKTRRISPECITAALVYKLLSRFCEGKAAAKRIGRPPLWNTGKSTEVESVISKNRRQTMLYLAEITGWGNPTVHMILKSTWKWHRHLQNAFHIYFWKMIADTTKLVTIFRRP